MVDTTKVTDAYGREVEVELGADGENPVSPNNPPAKAAYVDRANLETPDEDESVGIDGDRPVSPNNPPEGTQTVSEDAPGGHVPDGVSEAEAEAAQQEQYPVSYNPVKEDVDHGQPVATGPAPVSSEGDADVEPPAKSDLKAEWVDYAVSKGADRAEAEDMTKQELEDKYGA